MDISDFVEGVAAIIFGAFLIIIQIKRFGKGLKDPWGFQGSLLLCGVGCIVAGIILIIQAFK